MAQYKYSAFGKCEILHNVENIANINPFRFKCYYYDVESEMYYCHTRYFVPEWGRWLNADHCAYLELYNINGMNLFVYCGNNPIMYSDLDGYSWNSFWKGAGDWFKGVGNSIKNFFVDDVYGKVLVPIGNKISDIASTVWNEGLVPAWNAVSNFFAHDIPNFFVNTIWNGCWKDPSENKAFNGLLSFAGLLSVKANPIVGAAISVTALLLWFRTCFD